MKSALVILALVLAVVNAENALEVTRSASRGLLGATSSWSPCWMDSHCGSGSWCNTWATCTTCYNVGATCSRNSQCGTGWCNPNSWCCGQQPTPLPLLPNGASCSASSQCQSNFCQAGVCCNYVAPVPLPQPLPLLPSGAQCTTSGQCASGYCDICTGAAYGYCADSCSLWWWCNGGLSCSSGFCCRSCYQPITPLPVPIPVPTCSWSLPWGARCTADCQCACGQCCNGICTTATPVPVNRCGSNLPLYATCSSDCECACGRCYLGRCQSSGGSWPTPGGQGCTSAYSCPSGYFCQWTSAGSSCVPQKGASSPCGADWECQGTCSNGRCSSSCSGLWCSGNGIWGGKK